MELQIDGITVQLEKKAIKNMYLKVVPPDGTVKVSVPEQMEQEQIEAFVCSRRDWIRRNQEQMRKVPVPQPIVYETGSRIRVAGEIYSLRVLGTAGKPRIERRGRELWMYIKPGTGPEGHEKLLQKWQRQLLMEQIPALIHKWEPVIGKPVSEWHVKNMKTRWGTCNPAAGRIWLSLMLAEQPVQCLEYVVVHEMVHLLERSHNARFYAYMDQFLPEWRQLKAQLRDS